MLDVKSRKSAGESSRAPAPRPPRSEPAGLYSLDLSIARDRAGASADPTPMVTPQVGAYIHSLSSRGQPLSDVARGYFEPRFGHGFGGVRIHTDPAAQQSAAALRAKAYTVGNDVVFGAGEYSPNTSRGQRLLAHELTHVVQQGASTVRRTPLELKVGDEYVVQTPQGGNLLLRVHPDPATMLQGSDRCGGQAEKCPNSVGNVASGTRVKVTEVRLYDWYVVEARTVEGGKRIGFINEKFLKPVAAAVPATPVPEAPDVVAPEETEDTGVFEQGDEELEATESEEDGGRKVEQFGIIQTDDGANLWPAPDPERKQPHLGTLTQNTKVFLDRLLPGGWASVYVEKHQRPETLPVSSGTHGFVEAARVNTEMPDPDAWLHRITTDGQGALDLAAELYPTYPVSCALGVAACRDHRYVVNVLVIVNEAAKRRFLYKENPDDDWDKAKTIKATKGPDGKYTGGQIWVPGLEFLKALEGQVSSGSMSLETLNTLKEIIIGLAGFVVGLLHGAVMSVADIFIGVWDLIVLAKDIVVKLIEGTLISDAKALWADIEKIRISDVMDAIAQKWNAPGTWDRWHFRGYVIGYAIVEILLLFFSGGIATAVKVAGKAGKFGKFAKYLSELKSVKRLTDAAGALKDARLDKLRTAMKAATEISDAHGWAAGALKLSLGILRRLTEADIGKLKTLPQWARERFAALSDAVKLRLLGCTSPCKVDPGEIAKALKLAGTGGKKLDTVADVLGVLKGLDARFKIAKISVKLRKADSALMKAIKEAGLTDVDFEKLGDFLTLGDYDNPAQAYRTFVRYLTSVVPAKVGPDIKKLNEIAAAMVKAEPRRGAALKGAMFEQWVALHVPELAGRTFGRITFDLRTLIGKLFPPYKRHVDKWVPAKGEIWDMKHTFDKVPTGQADDYSKLVGKVAPDGKTVDSVNYLFPTLDAAKLNRHLADTYKFAVYYIDEATNTLTKLY